MKLTRLTVPGVSGALLLSAAMQADAADSTVTSGQLLEQSRLYAADYGRGLPAGDAATRHNRMQGMQDDSYNGTAVQTRMQEQVHDREHTYQGGDSGSRYGQGYESRSHNGGYGAGSGGSGRSGGKGGGRR